MPECYLKSIIKQIYLGEDIKRGYIGSQLFFSSSQKVTYHIDVNDVREVEVAYGESCLKPKGFTPTKEGCTFLGWIETSNVLPDADTMSVDYVKNNYVLQKKTMGTEPISLYAIFTKPVTATFVRQYSTKPSNSITKPLYYNTGLSSAPSFTAPSTIGSGSGVNYNGWTWLGWSSRDNKTNNASKAFGNGELISKGNDDSPRLYYDATFYGLYEKSVKLSYNANSGTGDMSSSTSSKKVYCNANDISNIYGASFTLEKCLYSKKGYTFSKWSFGKVNGKQYSVGEKVTLTTDTVFYANWTENSYTYIMNNNADWSKTAATSGAGSQVQNQNTYWKIPVNGYITFNIPLNVSNISKIMLKYNHSRDENGKLQIKLYLPSTSGFTDKDQSKIKSNEFADTGFVEVGNTAITKEFTIPSTWTGNRYLTIEVPKIDDTEHATLTLWQVAYK